MDTSDAAPLELQDLAATAALSSAAPTPTPVPAAHDGGAGHETAVALGRELQEQDDDDEDDDGDGQVTDARRNWGHDVTLALVRIWKRVCETHPHVGRVARMQFVYEEFKETVDCSHRSPKAVEDKLYSVKQMYQFIVKTSGSFHKSHGVNSGLVQDEDAGSRPVPAWFELTKDERRVVRSLHRVRIPNISLDVFNVLDSVLNLRAYAGSDAVDAPAAPVPPRRDAESATSSPIESSMKHHTSAEIVDNKRNWSHEVTLQLARAWHSAVRDQRDLRGAMLSQRVYTEFLRVVGTCSRSRKAIEDKMHSMKEMYRFIRLYNAGCVNGSGKALWFDLSKPDRRQIRNAHKIRVPNLSSEVYAELDAFMSQSVDVVESIPMGISQLIAAQQNLSMTPPPGHAPPAAVISTTTTSSSSNQTTTSNAFGAALTTTYEVMRRLAEEESQLVPPSLQSSPDSSPSGVPHGSALSASEISSAEELHGRIGPTEPPAKRQRTVGSAEPVSDQRLQELLALQRQAIAERRQQHAEQMALLLEIAGMLRQRAHG